MAPSPEPTPDLQSVPVPEQPPALLPGGAQMSLPLPQFEPAPQADASDNASSNEVCKAPFILGDVQPIFS